ncbi:aldo/keto reductase [Jatrophihabitans telluris]|uniref:Aldo/keto reductase n=1 Tax=Jatrophihabitans telluris TaxID=2038343 RepID=A0ABY4QU08_9ACTN|nr:aldo/keto reductase [Jatrophihabitans telluris]UQX86632.1 aldo/keto reductase [Jatrophihabitans telluris]
MDQLALGRSGLKVSQLGLGTMTWGNGTDPDEAAAILVAFHDAGGTLVDTAVSYSNGEAERILGSLLADVVPRSEVVLASKAGISRLGDERFIDASRGALLSRLDESLRNLGVDHLDLWQVHIPDPTVPAEETMAALEYAVASGKVRYVGVSNYSGWRTAQAAMLRRGSHAPLVSNQVRYSLLDRGIEREVVPACAEFGLGILPYSPLGGGVLTGKYRNGVPADSRGAAEGRNLAHYSDPRAVGIVEAVATAADGLATSPITVALSWLRNRPGITAPVVGARTLGQLTAALQSLTVELPLEIQLALDDVSAPVLGYPEELG